MSDNKQTILFEDLATEVQQSWSVDDWNTYHAIAADFQKEMRDREELGAALQSARKAKSLTQPTLSKLADVQQAEISRIERGLGNPTAATLFRLAHALGLKIAVIPEECTQHPRV